MIMNTIYLTAWTLLVLLNMGLYPIWYDGSCFIINNYGY